MSTETRLTNSPPTDSPKSNRNPNSKTDSELMERVVEKNFETLAEAAELSRSGVQTLVIDAQKQVDSSEIDQDAVDRGNDNVNPESAEQANLANRNDNGNRKNEGKKTVRKSTEGIRRETRSKRFNDPKVIEEKMEKKRNEKKKKIKEGRKSKILEEKDGGGIEENSDDDFENPRPGEIKSSTISVESKEEVVVGEKTSSATAYRCGLQSTYKTISLLREKKALTSKQIEFLKKTPFYDFFSVFYEKKISLTECKKKAENLDAVYSCYSVEKDCFVFGASEMEICPKDISLLFYMPLEGTDIDDTPKMTSKTTPTDCKEFVSRNFGKSTSIVRSLIEERIKQVIGKKKKVFEEDLPLLMIMLILLTFFFPNNQQRFRWGFVPYIVDVKKMRSVSWPKTIHSSLKKFVKSSIKNPRDMAGCSMIPLYVLCEKVNLIAQRKKFDNKIPRFARWDLRKLNKIVTKEFLDNFKAGQVMEVGKIELHETLLLECKESLANRAALKGKVAQNKKRKRGQQVQVVETAGLDMENRVLNYRITELEKENKEFKKKWMQERNLRRKAEEELCRLKEQMKEQKSEMQHDKTEDIVGLQTTTVDAHTVDNVECNEVRTAEVNNPNLDQDKLNDCMTNVEDRSFEEESIPDSLPNEKTPVTDKNSVGNSEIGSKSVQSIEDIEPPSFTFNLTAEIAKISARKGNSQKSRKKKIKKSSSKSRSVKPPSYVLRMRARTRTQKRKEEYEYYMNARKKARVTQKKDTESSSEGKNNELQLSLIPVYDEKSREKMINEDNVDKGKNVELVEPINIEEPSWKALKLSKCRKVTKHLDDEEGRIVRRFYSMSIAQENPIAWEHDDMERGGCCVTKDMLTELLRGSLTDGQIIDWCTLKCDLVDYNYAMSTMMTKGIMEGRSSIINCLVTPFLKEAALQKYTEKIYFPLHFGNHWSLLILAYANMQWVHYDSNRPRRSNKDNNLHLNEAYEVRKKVEEILQQIWVENKIVDKKIGDGEIFQEPCAQQHSDRVDCGIFVIINIISDNRAEIPLKVSKENMDKIRALIVREIISDHAFCWNLVRFVTGLTKKSSKKSMKK